MESLITTLLTQGSLGIIAGLALFVAWRKDRECARCQEKCAQDIRDRETKHADEMKLFQDKYITKAETWATRYQELTESTMKVVDSLERKFR